MGFKVPIYYGTGDDNENVVTYDNDTDYSGLPVPIKITPSGTIEISENGEYDVTQYASAEVSVSGGGVTPTGTKEISITANGTTTEDVTDYASAKITVDVANTYTAGDEGKVVSSGTLVSQGSDTVTQNGTVDTTLISRLTVNVTPQTSKTDLTIFNNRASGTISIGMVIDVNTVGLSTASKNASAQNSTSFTNVYVDPDGYIHFHCTSTPNSMTYNDAQLPTVASSGDIKVQLPAVFDSTIPIIFNV